MRIAEIHKGYVVFAAGFLERWAQLPIDYVCQKCGGAITVHTVPGSEQLEAGCIDCGGQEIITRLRFEEEMLDAYNVYRALPERLRNVYLDPADNLLPGQGIEELFDL